MSKKDLPSQEELRDMSATVLKLVQAGCTKMKLTTDNDVDLWVRFDLTYEDNEDDN